MSPLKLDSTFALTSLVGQYKEQAWSAITLSQPFQAEFQRVEDSVSLALLVKGVPKEPLTKSPCIN